MSLFATIMGHHLDLNESDTRLLASLEQIPSAVKKDELLWRARTRVGELFILPTLATDLTTRCRGASEGVTDVGRHQIPAHGGMGRGRGQSQGTTVRAVSLAQRLLPSGVVPWALQVSLTSTQ